ncbi:hypothetical protein PROFUN_12574 [Planoprotostelium fungivorum]|uniref:G-patch domain-containing protein n=1 Tax=Planoprotostelium fungivorum TaxID=1890364 RepID=A0A2P6N6T8_9EUKA|nr:hypothetical protein PROFUN_12574 [Planoprotostelium fungivorum]
MYEWEKTSSGVARKLLQRYGYNPGEGLGKEKKGIREAVKARPHQGRTGLGSSTHDTNRQKWAEWKKEGSSQRFNMMDEGQKRLMTETINLASDDDEDNISDEANEFFASSESLAQETAKEELDRVEKELEELKRQEKLAIEEENRKRKAYEFQIRQLKSEAESWFDLVQRLDLNDPNAQAQLIDRYRMMENQWDILSDLGSYSFAANQMYCSLEQLWRETWFNPSTSSQHFHRWIHSIYQFNRFFRNRCPKTFSQIGLDQLFSYWVLPCLEFIIKTEWMQGDTNSFLNQAIMWRALFSDIDTEVNDIFSDIMKTCLRDHLRPIDWSDIKKASSTTLSTLMNWSTICPIHRMISTPEVGEQMTNKLQEWDPYSSECDHVENDIRPWLFVVEQNHPIVENWIAIVFHKVHRPIRDERWDAEDLSVLSLMENWWDVLPHYLMDRLAACVVPRIQKLIKLKLKVTPSDQDLGPILTVMRWCRFLLKVREEYIWDVHRLLQHYFFPRWLQALSFWLSQVMTRGRAREIMRWYLGWKDLFIEEESPFSHVFYEKGGPHEAFFCGLQMIETKMSRENFR